MKLTEDQKEQLFQAMVEEVSDMTARDIVRTYLWPEDEDDEGFEALWEEYLMGEEDTVLIGEEGHSHTHPAPDLAGATVMDFKEGTDEQTG